MTIRPIRLTLAICSNRPDLVGDAVQNACAATLADDAVLVMLDGVSLATRLTEPRVTVLENEANRGLAYSRNRVLKECETRHAVFIDDDIRVTAETVAAARTALAEGVSVVGVRITADLQNRSAPWYLTSGQLHYLGCHDATAPASIWGGFLALDVEKVRLLGVEFDERLGRTAGTLASGEDTSFVREMVGRGARHEIVAGEAVHLVRADRLTLSYLMRRALWQGRTEYRRCDVRAGVRKEWRRNWRADCSLPRRAALVLLYGTCVLYGVLSEVVTAWLSASDPGAVQRGNRGKAAGNRPGRLGPPHSYRGLGN
jgi:glycosyltransferase involved in cell wall biosynthesis